MASLPTNLFPSILTISTGILAGSNTAISLICIPAIRATSDPLPAWQETYNNGKNIALTGIAIGAATSVKCYLDSGNTEYLVVAGLVSALPPYTIFLMKGINDTLFSIKDEERSRAVDRVRQLVEKWNLLHWGRTALSVGSFLATVYIIFK